MTDPYPDGNSVLWSRLLDKAKEEDERLFGILYWYRSVGANLVPNLKFGFIMKPMLLGKFDWGWRDDDEWQQEKQWLIPYAEQVSKLLMELRIEVNNKCL